MGAACFLVFDGDADFDTFVSGKGVMRQGEELAELAERLGVAPLHDFVCVTFAEMEDLVGDFEMPEDTNPTLGSVRWFSPQDVLATVRALAAHLDSHPDAVEDLDHVLSDLRQYENVLIQADQRGLKCHLKLEC